MTEPDRRISTRLRVAAQAIADAERAGMDRPPIDLDALDDRIRERVLGLARAALAAVADHEAAILADPDHPDAVGIADIDRLGAAIRAGTIAFLVRDRLGRARAVLWARPADAALVVGEAAQALWEGLAQAVRALPDLYSQEPKP